MVSYELIINFFMRIKILRANYYFNFHGSINTGLLVA